jgi:hypothetical protein
MAAISRATMAMPTAYSARRKPVSWLRRGFGNQATCSLCPAEASSSGVSRRRADPVARYQRCRATLDDVASTYVRWTTISSKAITFSRPSTTTDAP